MRPSYLANYLRISAPRVRGAASPRLDARVSAAARAARSRGMSGEARLMLNAISRYGVRVIPNTEQIVERSASDAASSSRARTSPAFEAAFAARLGAGRAIATSYGRMAFFYILQALDLPPGSEIVFPALTFWVMPEMARVAGLTPVFADVDPATFTSTAARSSAAITPRTARRRADASLGAAVRHGRDHGDRAAARAAR